MVCVCILFGIESFSISHCLLLVSCFNLLYLVGKERLIWFRKANNREANWGRWAIKVVFYVFIEKTGNRLLQNGGCFFIHHDLLETRFLSNLVWGNFFQTSHIFLFLVVNFENLTIKFHVLYTFNMHIIFHLNLVLFIIWSIKLFFIHNFRSQKFEILTFVW